MAYSETLSQRIRAVLARSSEITEKRMFGGLAFLKRGRMFVGVTGDDLMARVGKDAYADALARPHAREMDFTGRPMAGYVFVAGAGLEHEDDLASWVQRCERFVDTLPARASR